MLCMSVTLREELMLGKHTAVNRTLRHGIFLGAIECHHVSCVPSTRTVVVAYNFSGAISQNLLAGFSATPPGNIAA